MDWTDEPATLKQVKSLKQLGYRLERRLTKIEAAELIIKLGGKPEPATPSAHITLQEVALPEQYQFRARVEQARRAFEEAGSDNAEKLERELAAAIAERQCFWADTCRATGKGSAPSTQVHHLYQSLGCRFETPGRQEIQNILDALDSAMPFWDRDHPELFYQTLELNFPALLRRMQGLRV
ncbi:MAG TPA: hypothetical protein VN578_18145 [Candidatus Binatia bacterium]|nr:hypothetical protein [Candidatus Binatia bacterium]